MLAWSKNAFAPVLQLALAQTAEVYVSVEAFTTRVQIPDVGEYLMRENDGQTPIADFPKSRVCYEWGHDQETVIRNVIV